VLWHLSEQTLNERNPNVMLSLGVINDHIYICSALSQVDDKPKLSQSKKSLLF